MNEEAKYKILLEGKVMFTSNAYMETMRKLNVLVIKYGSKIKLITL